MSLQEPIPADIDENLVLFGRQLIMQAYYGRRLEKQPRFALLPRERAMFREAADDIIAALERRAELWRMREDYYGEW